MLDQAEGILDLTDKSPPDEIYRRLGMSKKAFKKSIGALYKQRVITITDKGIQRTEDSEKKSETKEVEPK